MIKFPELNNQTNKFKLNYIENRFGTQKIQSNLIEMWNELKNYDKIIIFDIKTFILSLFVSKVKQKRMKDKLERSLI